MPGDELQIVLDRITRIRRNFRKDSKERYSASYFENRLADLNSEWNKANDLYMKALSEVRKEDRDQFNSDIETHESHFYELRDILSEHLCQFRTNQTIGQIAPGNGHVSVRLPKIEIPRFNGRSENWTNFKDLFESLVHQSEQLTKTEKFHYLKQSLVGDAANLVKHINCVSENYDHAWDIVVRRYQNQRTLVNTYLKRVFGHSRVDNSAKSLERFLNLMHESLVTLKSLGQSVETWDSVVVYTVETKIDHDTRILWETEIKGMTGIPTWERFRQFLEQRLQVLEVLERPKVNNTDGLRCKAHVVAGKETDKLKCRMCNMEAHPLYQCDRFLKSSVSKRRKYVAANRICYSCLRSGHNAAACQSNSKCKRCEGRHNTLLHDPGTAGLNENAKIQQPVANTEVTTNACCVNTTTLLPTARVNLIANGRIITVKALIDQGSQRNFISEKVARALNIKMKKTGVRISGVGEQIINPLGTAMVQAQSIHDERSKINLEALILKSVTGVLPNRAVVVQPWDHLKDLQLADPNFDSPEKIDCLIGAGEISAIMLPGIRNNGVQEPLAQKTIFGWILSGPVNAVNCFEASLTAITADKGLDDLIRRFWESEEVSNDKREHTQEEEDCEDHYKATHKRDSTGKYIVQLPLKLEPRVLGDSRRQAEERFRSLERKFQHNPQLKKDYTAAIMGYLTEGHMELVPTPERNTLTYYMPHHAVIKETSTTTKLRIVFDASAKSSSGHSLNSIMKVGPVVQKDLFALLLNWRQYQYAMTADIKAMYRQIWVDEQQRDLQRILWRPNPEEMIREYRMKALTFGTAAAPYLATRTLQQLAIDEGEAFLIGSETLKNHFYVDDMLTGAASIEAACKIRDEVIQLLASGGFHIRKWSSNDPKILEGLPAESIELNIKELWLGSKELCVKTLGMEWDPNLDIFRYTPIKFRLMERVTKRGMASIVAKLFDPLGWISPVVVLGKALLQRIWLLQNDWDEEVPDNIQIEWNKYQDALQHIHTIQVPRWLGLKNNTADVQIHGFCDASEKAYAACVYLRICDANHVFTRLITAKSKIAPLKKLTLPRLELCGATLLVRLLKKIITVYNLDKYTVYAWTDSMIVLSWIQQSPHKWKVYVANRVSEVHDHQYISQWRYIPTKDNPADIATRGMCAKNLAGCRVWWHGPFWLQQSHDNWPKLKGVTETTLESSPRSLMASTVRPPNEILHRFSTIDRLVRITAWCCRWRNKTKGPFITVEEMKSAEHFWVKIVQADSFEQEIHRLRNNKSIHAGSRITELTPFIDSVGILRMMGRLRNSALSFDEKHPIILPSVGHFTDMIVRRAHLETLHGGVQLTLSHLRRKYWICRGRQSVKRTVHACQTCARYRQAACQQLMGNLPSTRVSPNKPFQVVGLDYAGPIDVRRHKGRGSPKIKTYIAVFVCFTTKAVHLELVTDMTSSALIATIRRFVARRGRCDHIYSDNGRNMVGAANWLKELRKSVDLQHQDIGQQTASLSIVWHFIPPGAPHFGGLWEAAVKSTKTHLKKILGSTTFTIEEMFTALCQIEACLNSRPLCKISDDPEDDSILTPSHFLIGSNSVAISDGSLEFSKTALLNRWNAVQYRVQQFWRQWSREYLSTLMTRSKWRTVTSDVLVGQLVLLRDDNLPPSCWSKGIIKDVIKGADGLVRVVTVKTIHGVFQRPITKVCLLPMDLDKTGHVDYTPPNEELVHAVAVSEPKAQSYRVAAGPGWKWWWILLTIISCFYNLGQAQVEKQDSWYNVSKFTTQTGLLYEHKSNLKWVTSHWTLLAYCNLTTYESEIGQIETSIDKLKQWCHKDIADKHYCTAVEVRLRKLFEQIVDNDSLLRNHHGVMHQRIKRGLLNVVGGIANKLFGVLDEEFAENYQREITAIKNNQLHLENLSRKQISVLDLTQRLLKQQDEQTQNLTQSLNNNLASIENAISRVETFEETQWGLEKLVTLLSWDVNAFRRHQEALLAIILDAQHGVINTEVLPVHLIKELLSEIHGRLPNGQHVLYAAQMNWKDLYKVMDVKVAALVDTIILEVRLPIVYSEEFVLYKIHSLPTCLNHTYIYVVPNVDNLVFNSRRDRYFTLTDEEVKQCGTSTDIVLCEFRGPIHNLKSHENACEVNTFLHEAIDKENCAVASMTPRPVWITLQNSMWIFILNQSNLTMAPGCSLRHQSFLIQNTLQSLSTVIKVNNVIPQGDFGGTASIKYAFPKLQTPLTWKHLNWTEQNIIDDQTSLFNYPMTSSAHDHYQNIALGCILTLCIMAIASMVIWTRRNLTPRTPPRRILPLPLDDEAMTTREETSESRKDRNSA